MSKYFVIDGYWKDDKTEFSGYIIKDTHDIDENDEDIFYYGIPKGYIEDCIRLGEDTPNDFVITSYKEK